MSLLLKSLKQTAWQPRVAAESESTSTANRYSEFRALPASEPTALDHATTVVSDLVSIVTDKLRFDPAGSTTNAIALIDPFEPIASTAVEFLPPDALSDIECREGCCSDTNAVDQRATAEVRPSFGEPQQTDRHRTEGADDSLHPALRRLEELQRLLARDRAEAAQSTVPAPFQSPVPQALPPRPKLPLRDELRELRDHLLAKFPFNLPSTLLVVDAGRTPLDASWLVPLAASMAEHFSETHQRNVKVLIVEAVGPDCSVARSMGLQTVGGLTDALHDAAQLEKNLMPTEDPQLFLLARGRGEIRSSDEPSLQKIWPQLQRQFDMIFIAGGPLTEVARSEPMSAVESCLPLADGVVVAVELDGTPQEVAAATYRRLAACGAKLIGCVVLGDG